MDIERLKHSAELAQDGQKPWKSGNEFAPYHPSASHINPDYRDGWNACYHAAAALIAELEKLRGDVEILRPALIDWSESAAGDDAADEVLCGLIEKLYKGV